MSFVFKELHWHLQASKDLHRERRRELCILRQSAVRWRHSEHARRSFVGRYAGEVLDDEEICSRRRWRHGRGGAWYKDGGGPDERQGMPRPSWTRLFPRLTSSLRGLPLGVVRLQDLSRTDGVHACLSIPDMMEDSAESAPFCTRLPRPTQRTDKAIRSLIATCSSIYPITTSDLEALINHSTRSGSCEAGHRTHLGNTEHVGELD